MPAPALSREQSHEPQSAHDPAPAPTSTCGVADTGVGLTQGAGIGTGLRNLQMLKPTK
jgi:hypothetical protein